MSWRRLMYSLMYRFGAPRWDTSITPPEVVAVIEGAAALPAGRALDLGCGTGTNVIYLAQHGWETIGVDFSPVAIQQARQKAKDTPGATFVEGDVSQLLHLGIQSPFDFVFDIGCFHGLPAYSRQTYVQGVNNTAESQAVFAPGRTRVGARIVSRSAPRASSVHSGRLQASCDEHERPELTTVMQV